MSYVTIEEPVEFIATTTEAPQLSGKSRANSSSFAAGLKAALREDTDIVAGGNARPYETVSLALTAAGNGPSLVFGTAR